MISSYVWFIFFLSEFVAPQLRSSSKKLTSWVLSLSAEKSKFSFFNSKIEDLEIHVNKQNLKKSKVNSIKQTPGSNSSGSD